MKKDTVRAEVLDQQDIALEKTKALPAAMAALLLGSFMVLGVGFAHSETVHNVAHDARHAFSFPCH